MSPPDKPAAAAADRAAPGLVAFLVAIGRLALLGAGALLVLVSMVMVSAPAGHCMPNSPAGLTEYGPFALLALGAYAAAGFPTWKLTGRALHAYTPARAAFAALACAATVSLGLAATLMGIFGSLC